MIYFNVDMLVSIYMCETEKDYISFSQLEKLTAQVNKNIFEDKLNLTIFSSQFFIDQMLDTHRDIFQKVNKGIKLKEGITATRLKKRLTNFLDEQKVVAPLRKYVNDFVSATNKQVLNNSEKPICNTAKTQPKAKENAKL